MNYYLKQMVDSMYHLCDIMDEESNGKVQGACEQAMRVSLQTDLVAYLMYLSVSDGTISWQEADFIRTYLGCDLSTTEIRDFIEENEIYSTKFESSTPLCMQLFVQADNIVFEKNGIIEYTPASELLFSLYEALGEEFLACDSSVCDEELSDLRTYVDTLRTYIQENLIKPHVKKPKPIEKKDTSVSFAKKENGTGDAAEKENAQEDAVEDLDVLLEELHALTGLSAVKKDVNSLINLLKIHQIRKERGLKQMPMSLHLVFSGNPGTGKTTVARLLAKIYHQLGVLSKGHLVEVDRSRLVGGYVGQTAIKVQNVIQKSLGGILFIDEAYALTAKKGEQDYGFEAVDTLLKGMEDHRHDLIVIVAGYPHLMQEFLNSHPGLRSRFNKFIDFLDYNPNELMSIFISMCENAGYFISEECRLFVQDYFERRYATRNANYANGRDVRNFFEAAMINQADRLSKYAHISDEELAELQLADVENIAL